MLLNALKRPLRPLKGQTLHSLQMVRDRLRYGPLSKYIARSQAIPGWTYGEEAGTLAQTAWQLSKDAVIVEIGSFLGRSAVLLAGARKLAGSGKVHCVDPFDASGDVFSVLDYRAIADSLHTSLRQRFEENIRRAGLSAWVEVHQGTAQEISATWRQPVDMLFLDGDQSPQGVRAAYEGWAPFLKIGGVIAVHNSSERTYKDTHDGHRRLVVETIHLPEYTAMRCIGTTTFARRVLQ